MIRGDEYIREYLRPVMEAKRERNREAIRRQERLTLVKGGLIWGSAIVFGILFWILIFCAISYADVVGEVIAAEACSEGLTGMTAVANTINNRAKAWHKTPLAIVMAKNQYYGLTNSNRYKIYKGCKNQADYLSTNIDKIPDITHGALYFLLPNEPRRSWHKQFLVKIGKHSFWR